ncbi:MAG: DUF192 domain-containing protein [Nanoarchaeota archaeon]
MILNKTKKLAIAANSRTCKTLISNAIGLMFSKKIADFGLIFVFDKPKKAGLHMFFVFFPIDVLFLDEKKKVIELKRGFKPFTLYYPKKKAKYILELPKDTIKSTSTEIGDEVMFIA